MTTTTTRITKLSSVLLTSALLVLSSVAAAQLLVINSNTAFAEPNHEPCTSTVTDGILEETCSGGGPLGEEAEGVGGSGGHCTSTTDLSTSYQLAIN